jgi:adenylate cyclase
MKTAPPAEPHQERIREQLRRIRESKSFKSSPRLSGLLEFLVGEVLAGKGDTLGEYRVGTEALGLSQDFDPGAKSLVRSHAGRLRKALAAYYESEGRNDDILISLPPVGYRVVFSKPESAKNRRRSIANLPMLLVSEFRGIGLKDALRDLPVTMAEELSLRLSRAAHLRVARTGAGGAALDPDFLLEGSIEQRGSKLLIRSRLMEGATGLQIWGKRHEFPATRWNPEAMEEEIVEAIAVETGSDFGRIDRHLLWKSSTSKRDAPSLQSALLKVKAFVTDCSEKSHKAAVTALQRFLKISPANAEAHATLGVLMLIAHCEYFRRTAAFPAAALEHFAIAQVGDPRNPYLRYGRVLELLVSRRHDEVGPSADEIISDPDFPPGLSAFACLCQLYTRTATERTRRFLTGYMKQNPEYPRVFHTGFALEHLSAGNLVAAGRETELAHIPGYWFGPVMSLAIHQPAGRQAEAKAARAELRRLCPDFALHGREVLARSLHPEFVDLLMSAHASRV